MRIEEDIKLDFKDVLIRPKRSELPSRSHVQLERTFSFLHSNHQWTGVPIIAANMDQTGTFEIAKVLSKSQVLTAIDKNLSDEQWQEVNRDFADVVPFTFISFGEVKPEYHDELKKQVEAANTPFICIDVANGYRESFVDFVKRMRDMFPDKVIMAGNVVTGEMVEQLILSGADIVKVGIGPGSVCTTRKMTGVGYPQLSAIIECADAAHGLKGHVCADGGCTVPGDVAKAFAAGADFTMLGGMFAGHDECMGEIIEKNGRKYKQFYGMSSEEAMVRYSGGMAAYRASEGREILVPYRGPVQKTVEEILGGIRSTCTYVGASTLKELSKRTTFVRVTQQLNEIFREHEIEKNS